MSNVFRNLVFTTALIALAGDVHSQTTAPLSYFPHHLGDVWEYVDPNHPNVYEQNIVTSDSTGPGGRYYVQTSRFGNFIVDTNSLDVYNTFATGQDLYYKLAADVGTYWIVRQNGPSRKSAKVVSVYQSTIFGGNVVTVKVINNYSVNAGGTDSLLTNTDYLASGFGLIRQNFDGFPARMLRGARINSVQYGTITSVHEYPNYRSHIEFKLYQNFPNPFNPLTKISYELEEPDYVELKVYDITGREIKTILSTYQLPGAYVVDFRSDGISSGTYFCVLMTETHIQARKMIISK